MCIFKIKIDKTISNNNSITNKLNDVYKILKKSSLLQIWVGFRSSAVSLLHLNKISYGLKYKQRDYKGIT